MFLYDIIINFVSVKIRKHETETDNINDNDISPYRMYE